MASLIEQLKAAPKEHFSPHPPGDPAVMARVEQTFGFRFPDDFRAAMLWSDGFATKQRRSAMSVPRLKNLESDNMDEQYETYLPEMFIIGTDNGGSVYFLDPHDRLGNGKFAVYLVPLGEIGFDRAMLCGSSFTEAVEASLRNESFFDRPRLKETRG